MHFVKFLKSTPEPFLDGVDKKVESVFSTAGRRRAPQTVSGGDGSASQSHNTKCTALNADTDVPDFDKIPGSYLKDFDEIPDVAH